MSDPNIQTDLLHKPAKTKKKDKTPEMAPPTQPVAKLPAALQGLPATDSAERAAAGMAGLIEKVLLNPDFDVQKAQALLDMQLQVWDRMAKMAFARDFAAMSQVLPRIAKKGSVAYDKEKGNKAAGQEEAFKFALLEDIDAVVRPILPQYGFSISFTTRVREGGGLISIGTLSHKDGFTQTAEIPLAIDTSGGKNNLQGMGSTTSYGIRYLIRILLHLITVGEDNDGAGDPPAVIDNEKAVEIDVALNAKITEYDADGKKGLKDRFLKHFGIDAVPNLKAKDYQAATVLIASIGQKPQQKKAS